MQFFLLKILFNEMYFLPVLPSLPEFYIFAKITIFFQMRLGQLARNLEVTTTDIVNFLSEQQITVKDHPNVKLDEISEQQVIKAFSGATTFNETPPSTAAVSEENKPEQEEVISIPTEVNEEPESTQEEPEEPEVTMEEEPVNATAKPTTENVQEEEVEVIKAPKIELQGLKVVGKIELPEPKTEEKPKEEKKVTNGKKSNGRKKNPKRELTEEEKEKRRIKSKKARKKREEREKEKQKELEQKRLKKKKKEHYLKKIHKPQPPVSKKEKRIKEQEKQNKHVPKTLLGKFWKWLNT